MITELAEVFFGRSKKNRSADPLQFWTGGFGDEYTDRNNPTHQNMVSRTNMWREIRASLPGGLQLQNIVEVGASVGNNIVALRALSWPNKKPLFYGIEPNKRAREGLKFVADEALDGTITDIPLSSGFDLVFTSGVLIHIPPHKLLDACKEIYRVSGKYIVSIEYNSEQPEAIPYRGQDEGIWKRDYGKFWLDNFPRLRPVGCGFMWREMTGLDNLTWWALEK